MTPKTDTRPSLDEHTVAMPPASAPTEPTVDQGRRGGVLVGVIAAAVLAIVLGWLLWPKSAAAPAPTPSSSSTAGGIIPAPTTNAAGVAAAQQAYRTWDASVVQAYTAGDSTKLNSSVASPSVYNAAKTDVDGIAARLKGINGTERYTSDIRSITVDSTRSSDTAVTMTVCSMRVDRFISAQGQDITFDSSGKAIPVPTSPIAQEAKANLVNGVWVITQYELDSRTGQPCAG